jgi:hypothetical protein
VRQIRTLRAMRRELETEPRRVLNGHGGGNPRHSQGYSYGSPRQFPTLPAERSIPNRQVQSFQSIRNYWQGQQIDRTNECH